MPHRELQDDVLQTIASVDHVIGPASARVTLIEYADFTSPECVQAFPQIKHLIRHYGKRLRLVFRHFAQIELRPQAELVAEAAEAAGAQSRFWPMHDLIFEHYPALGPEVLRRHAQDLRLDMQRFDTELTEHFYRQRIQEHRAAGRDSGVSIPPGFVLGNWLINVSTSGVSSDKVSSDMDALFRAIEVRMRQV